MTYTRIGIRTHSAPQSFTIRRALPLIAAAAGLVGGFAPLRPAVAAGGTGGFQTYKDAHLGFALAKPDGWTVQTSDTSITVEAPDKSELVLTEMFHAAPGDTAEQWLEKLADKHTALFPQPGVDNLRHQHTKGDEVIAALHYAGPNGPAQLRVLCSIVGGKGLLYAMAAPTDRFAAERPKLLHVAQSLVFTVPKGSGKANGGAGGQMTAAQVAATARGMHWVTWTDPREHAFHISVPQGWKVQGGAFRGGSEVRIAYVVISPKGDIAVESGDPQLGTFVGPNGLSRQMGQQEGQNGLLHYMRAPEFNQMYLREKFSKLLDNLTIGQSQEFTQMSRDATQQLNESRHGMGSAEVSMGLTQFKGADKQSGKQMGGIIITRTQRTLNPIANGAMSTTWLASPLIITSAIGDAEESARARTAMAVFNHVLASYREDPAWLERRRQELGAVNSANIAATAARSKQIAADSAATENAIMGRFESRRQAQDEQQRGFINYIGDRTDVTDAAGNTANVASGSSRYYRNDRTGAVMGTNSAYSPGVDFTPMAEY